MYTSNVHRLDAFHERPNTVAGYGYPKNAHIYAKRALPPVPKINTIRKSSSSTSLKSPKSSGPRPTLSPVRAATCDYIDRSKELPALPSLSRVPSADSVASSRPSDVETTIEAAPLRRPRTARSISFRNFLNRNSGNAFSAPTMSESGRSVSSMSATSECSHDSRHDSIVGDCGLTMVKSTTVTQTSAPGSRRPSTLSLASLRARKVTPESQQSAPSSARKSSASISSGRRWAFLHGATEDAENVPPIPITPPPVTELSCHRCYYFSMRNCNGWVMGGSHGDACDSCTVSFTTSKSISTGY